MSEKYANGSLLGLTFLAGLVAGAGPAIAQSGFNPSRMAREALAEPFVGVTTDGSAEHDLYSIEQTGLSTEPVRGAARAFLGTLTEGEREAAVRPVDSDDWRHWSNFHQFPGRNGLQLEDLTEPQRAAALDLLRASLSANGYDTSRDIMRLNHHLGELVENFEEYGEFKYWLTFYGSPSAEEPWGWQFEGHHLVINYVLLGNQIVMTPTFMGSEPVRAEGGRFAGTEVLQDVQDAGLALLTALPKAQREMAVIGQKQGRSSARAELFSDNVVLPFAGVPVDEISPEAQDRLMELIALHVENMPQGQARVRMDEIRAHLDDTHFAWIGGTSSRDTFYYRIQSPVVLIEFDHQGPIALGDMGDPPTRDHVHTVVRTPNGNDYGRDLLRQHLEASRDDPDHGHSHD